MVCLSVVAMINCKEHEANFPDFVCILCVLTSLCLCYYLCCWPKGRTFPKQHVMLMFCSKWGWIRVQHSRSPIGCHVSGSIPPDLSNGEALRLRGPIHVPNCTWHLENKRPSAPANWRTQLRTHWVNYIVIVCCFYVWNSKSSPQRGAQGFSPSCCGWTTSASAPNKSGDTHFISTIF